MHTSRYLSWWPSTLTLAVVLYATLYPDPAGVDELPAIPHLDKLIHALMFGGLAGAWAFDYCRARHLQRPPRRVMLIAALVSAALGGVIELIQDAMGLGRGADMLDFAADSIGCVAAFFLAPPAIRAVLRPRQTN